MRRWQHPLLLVLQRYPRCPTTTASNCSTTTSRQLPATTRANYVLRVILPQHKCASHTCEHVLITGPPQTEAIDPVEEAPLQESADPIDGNSDSAEDHPTAADRVLPGRPRVPIDPLHYMTHSPKHPDCEVCSRTMLQNTPCRRQHKPHPPAEPTRGGYCL